MHLVSLLLDARQVVLKRNRCWVQLTKASCNQDDAHSCIALAISLTENAHVQRDI